MPWPSPTTASCTASSISTRPPRRPASSPSSAARSTWRPGAATDKVHGVDSEAYHLVLLCMNETGYQNLSYMVSQGFLDGFYGKPRVDMELLRSHSEGLICLSACVAGQVPQLLLSDDYEAAKAKALEFAEIFPGRYYLEIQDHGLDVQARVNQGLLRIAGETGLPLVATNDAHYLRPEESRAAGCPHVHPDAEDRGRSRPDAL